MPHQPTWKYVEGTGPDKATKEIIEKYDDYYGEYQCNVDKTMANKPSKDTKSPFKGLSGGK